MLDKIHIVLVETSHPGNIGSAARAMKTMGLKNLILVRPKKFPDQEATIMASNADDILEQVTVVDSLDEALADCNLVLGTSGRDRRLPWPLISPREAVSVIRQEAIFLEKVAIVFGNERTGLTNDELKRCHHHIHIPSNPDYCSLNLAQAVQVLAYECRIGLLEEAKIPLHQEPYANAQEVEGFYQHLEETIEALDILDRSHPKKFSLKIRRVFQRTRLTVPEINILIS